MRRPRIFMLYATLAGLALPAAARAECSLSVDGVDAARIEAAFANRADIDQCAKVRVFAQRVEVELADGRGATRPIARVEDALLTLEALLVVPPSPPPPEMVIGVAEPEPVREASPEASPPAEPMLPVVIVALPREAPIARPSSSGTHLDLSFSTDGRVGMPRTSGYGLAGVGVGVSSLFAVSSWVIGVEGRYDQYASLQHVQPDTAAPQWVSSPSLGGLIGRRIALNGAALDLLGGAGVAVHSGHRATMHVSPETQPIILADEPAGAVPRLRLAARLELGTHQKIGGFIAFDTEAGPADGGLPGLTAGLALGATMRAW